MTEDPTKPAERLRRFERINFACLVAMALSCVLVTFPLAVGSVGGFIYSSLVGVTFALAFVLFVSALLTLAALARRTDHIRRSIADQALKQGDFPCPNCAYPVVPSGDGFLCPECGHKATAGQLARHWSLATAPKDTDQEPPT